MPALAEDCPGNPDALGTYRTIAVDPAETPLIGTMSYPKTLKLAPKEVVLTFDDGPYPPMSAKVLETLRKECVKATYFLIGRNARLFPELVREIAKEGHSIGTHSQNHPFGFQRIGFERGVREINDGIRSVSEALEPLGQKPLPWFRFPGFDHTRALDNYLQSQHMIAVGADFPADDWLRENHNRPDVIYARAMSRLERHGSGILLLHDVQPATAKMLPRLLRTLKAKGYHVVQMVPAEKPSGTPVAEAPAAPAPLPVVASAAEPAVAAKPARRFARHRRHHRRARVENANWWQPQKFWWQNAQSHAAR
jgi:peptidoglycan/xylan/chitin deacetylase (PgdA/CDA1 family)